MGKQKFNEREIVDLGVCTNDNTGSCPVFVVNEKEHTVTLIDRRGNKSSMSIAEWNKLVKLIRTEVIGKIR
jgi:hypothetical protein